MANRGQISQEAATLVAAARAQWGEGAVERTSNGRCFKIKPPSAPEERGRLIVIAVQSRARGSANARAMLRQAGLKLPS